MSDSIEQRCKDSPRMARAWAMASFRMERFINKHSFEPAQSTPGKRDQTLTIEHMGGKVETIEKLHSILLPSINDQLTSLLNSLDVIHPQKNPESEIGPTAQIISSLDKTLESIVSSIVSLTLESLPDENHDYGLEKLKAFRCSYIRANVMYLVGDIIYGRLFPDLSTLIGRCSIAIYLTEDSEDWEEISRLRGLIAMSTASSHRMINATIRWCQLSDWALVQEGWLVASNSLDGILDTILNSRTNFIEYTSELSRNGFDVNLNERSALLLEFVTEVAKSAIPIIKLGRILTKRTSETIWKKRLLGSGGTDLNSETMERLYETPHSIYNSLVGLSNHLFSLSSSPILTARQQNEIRDSVVVFPKVMESTLSALDACLFPILPRLDDEPPEGRLKSLCPTLKQSWDLASDNLISVISSFQVERIGI
ncbi:hypothetical protein PtA15_5A907 [Puccinia triticina]|uniref:Uncharacterized protein n=1 Tax=Puccinia triticina TaxID=208348 RepID=A0ABY7CRH7_9BASI|nr:uncharacterized protein PtA15_5A907 [Puccinia triticina]WAQ85332.1 hypothetical protein PtA15_5A907 [Puccinia triticina]